MLGFRWQSVFALDRGDDGWSPLQFWPGGEGPYRPPTRTLTTPLGSPSSISWWRMALSFLGAEVTGRSTPVKPPQRAEGRPNPRKSSGGLPVLDGMGFGTAPIGEDQILDGDRRQLARGSSTFRLTYRPHCRPPAGILTLGFGKIYN